MKLWTATFEVTVVVAAESEPSEWSIKRLAEQEMRDSGDCYGVTEIKEVGNIPYEWTDVAPYLEGKSYCADRTCKEFFTGTIAEQEAAEEARLEAVRNAPMPNQMSLPMEDAK